MKYDVSNKISEMHTPTAVIAANLEKQVGQLRDTVITMQPLSDESIEKSIEDWKARCDSGEKIQMIPLRDDLLESAHSREKAELQKALAARIGEVQNLAADVAYEREKNKTQAESIGQCLDEIERLKRLVALRTQDLAVYQKELKDADNRADDAEYKAAEFERDLVVQRAWTWFFLVLSFVAAVVGVVK